MKPGGKVRYIRKREVDARRSSAGRGATAGNGQLAEAPANDSGDSQRSQQTTQFASAKRFAASILLALLLCGCAARKPAIRHGHDRPPKHQAEWACYAGKPDDPNSWWGDPTPVGIFAWKYFRLQWPFGVRCYDLSKPKQDVKPHCDGPYEYNWKTMRCERKP